MKEWVIVCIYDDRVIPIVNDGGDLAKWTKQGAKKYALKSSLCQASIVFMLNFKTGETNTL